MKKVISIFAFLTLISAICLSVAFPTFALDESAYLYKITFESEKDSLLLIKAGKSVGEIVEYPEGSGNHALKYTIDKTTRTTEQGCHPFILPAGTSYKLASQGPLDDNHSLTFRVKMAYDGPIFTDAYMDAIMLINDETEVKMVSSEKFVPANRGGYFAQGEWTVANYGNEEEKPLPGMANGAVTFMDHQTIDEGITIYMDDIELIWNGSWNDKPEYCRISTNLEDEIPYRVYYRGDCNMDDNLDLKDVLLLRKVVAGFKDVDCNLSLGDCDGNEAIDLKDILALRKLVS